MKKLFLVMIAISFGFGCTDDTGFSGKSGLNSSAPKPAPSAGDAAPEEPETVIEDEFGDPTQESTYTSEEEQPIEEDVPKSPELCEPNNKEAFPPFDYTLDANSGELVILADGGSTKVEFKGTDQPNEITLVRDDNETFVFNCVKTLTFDGGPGADWVIIDGGQGIIEVTIQGGAGADRLVLAEGNDGHGANLVISGGVGDDTIEISSAQNWSGVTVNGD